MKVNCHLIGTPAAQKLDFIVVNDSQEEGHDTVGANCLDANVLKADDQ